MRVRDTVTVAAATISFAGLFVLLAPRVGPEVAALGIVVPILAGSLGGRRVGAVAGLFVVALDMTLQAWVTRVPVPTPPLIVASAAINSGLGWGSGWMRETNARLRSLAREERRGRQEAEAASLRSAQLADRLRESEDLLARTQQLSSTGSWRMTVGVPGGTCSPNLRRLLGLPPGCDFEPEELASLIHPDDLQAFLAEVQDAQDRLGPLVATCRVVRPDGQVRWFRTHLKFEALANGRVGIIGLSQDVTEQREADAALQRNDRLTTLGTLVAGVAHEINNPLMFMQGSLELAQLDIQDARADLTRASQVLDSIQNAQETVLAGIDRIGHITRSLKILSRSDESRVEALDPNEMARDVASVVRTRLGCHIELREELAATRRIEMNPTQLSQVLLNLLINASEALHGKNGGRITIRTHDAADDTLIEVEDDGPGIPVSVQARIFTPFFTTKPQGTGLGLALSRSIAQAHGGDVTFDTGLTTGTTFRLRVPSARPAVRPVRAVEAPAAAMQG